MQNEQVSVKTTTKCQNTNAYHKGKMMLCICLISTKKKKFKNSLLFAQGNKNPTNYTMSSRWASLALLNMSHLCDLLSHEKTGTAVSPLLAEVLFPTAVFLLSHKWKQVHSPYSVDIPQAFFQNVDESFSSLFFLWWTAFPCILHIFLQLQKDVEPPFLHILKGCRFHHQLPQAVSGQGKSMYKLDLRTMEISCY